MDFDPAYWDKHYPTKEEAVLVVECCDKGDCSHCPYGSVGCGHFGISKVKRQALKEFMEENTNLKEAYRELQAEFAKYVKGETDEI